MSLPEFEDMLLFLVISGNITHSILQADGNLIVVGNALTGILVVFVEAHLMVIYYTVHVMPGPETEGAKGRSQPDNIQSIYIIYCQ